MLQSAFIEEERRAVAYLLSAPKLGDIRDATLGGTEQVYAEAHKEAVGSICL